jgi:7,8-didemethyl-8-hydroxy-5-deazariboflavin synthase
MPDRVITYSRNVFLPLTTVCRNRCGYCSFRTPVQPGCLMPQADVERTLRNGAAAGCTEALFTFGEHPEEEPGFVPLIRAAGYATILDYCEAMCRNAIGCGILPHTNAGIMTCEEMERLRPFNASMGLMLETTAEIPAHATSKGKSPDVRLAMIEDAGKLKIPFTTGLLLGIGETMADREDSLFAIRDLHKRYGHIQEIIIQNFCPKPGTPLAGSPLPTTDEICATIRMAKDILPSDIAVQIPPNLVDAAALISCGVDDLGGVSPLTIDYINPDHPWPAMDELKRIAGEAVLRERLCIYPQYIERGWFHSDLQPLINRLSQTVQQRSGGP